MAHADAAAASRGTRPLLALAALAYLGVLLWSLVASWALALAPFVLVVAVVALFRWGRRVDAKGARLEDAAAPLLALALVPFARLLVWNTQSPLFEAVFDATGEVSRFVSGGWNPRHLAPAHQALVLAVRLVPFALAVLAWATGPLVIGALVSRRLPAFRPRVAFPVLSIAVVGLVVAWPVACDTHESWDDVPNARCACAGLEVPWYPPGVSDGASTDYCIGVERPPPPSPSP